MDYELENEVQEAIQKVDKLAGKLTVIIDDRFGIIQEWAALRLEQTGSDAEELKEYNPTFFSIWLMRIKQIYSHIKRWLGFKSTPHYKPTKQDLTDKGESSGYELTDRIYALCEEVKETWEDEMKTIKTTLFEKVTSCIPDPMERNQQLAKVVHYVYYLPAPGEKIVRLKEIPFSRDNKQQITEMLSDLHHTIQFKLEESHNKQIQKYHSIINKNK